MKKRSILLQTCMKHVKFMEHLWVDCKKWAFKAAWFSRLATSCFRKKLQLREVDQSPYHHGLTVPSVGSVCQSCTAPYLKLETSCDEQDHSNLWALWPTTEAKNQEGLHLLRWHTHTSHGTGFRCNCPSRVGSIEASNCCTVLKIPPGRRITAGRSRNGKTTWTSCTLGIVTAWWTNHGTCIWMWNHVGPPTATIAPRTFPSRYAYAPLNEGLRCQRQACGPLHIHTTPCVRRVHTHTPTRTRTSAKNPVHSIYFIIRFETFWNTGQFCVFCAFCALCVACDPPGLLCRSRGCREIYIPADWWFGTSFIFPYIGNNPIWLIFFRGVQTTNQPVNLLIQSPLRLILSIDNPSQDALSKAGQALWDVPI